LKEGSSVIVRHQGGNECRLMHWGLIPHWAADPSIANRMINARAETLGEREAEDVSRPRQPSNAYLQWMFDNQPEYVKEFLDQDRIGELDQILINQLASALRFIDILMKSGLRRYEAEDIAIEVLLAPADGRAF